MTGFTPQVRSIVHQRADWWCERCGMTRGVQMHHRRARGMGGTNRPETNRPSAAGWLCLKCHCWVENNRDAARNEGWLVRQTDNPADIPVMYRGGKVILDDLGNLRSAA